MNGDVSVEAVADEADEVPDGVGACSGWRRRSSCRALIIHDACLAVRRTPENVPAVIRLNEDRHAAAINRGRGSVRAAAG